MIEYFLDPYPDELLYSVWARYSDQVNYPSKTDAFLELFGSREVRPIVDLPCRLQCFVDRLPLEHAYTVDFFIDNHTLFPYYRAFLPVERCQIVREEMIFGKGIGIHDLAGVITKIMPSVWLRFCPECVKEDKKKYHECYWHRLHQLPGVEVCPLHKMFLEKSNARIRHGDMTPFGMISAEKALRDVIPRRVESFPLFDILLCIAQESSYLLENFSHTIDMHRLYQNYRAILSQHDFLTQRGRIRVYDLFNAFEGYYSPELLSLFQCNLKIMRGQVADQWLGRIFDLPGTKRSPVFHPLYHLLVIHFLGSTLKTILSQEIPMFAPFGTGPWPCLNPVCEHFQHKKILTYQLPEANKNRTIVGRFSCECGYVYSRIGPDTSPDDAFRGKVLLYGPMWDDKLRELWFDSAFSMTKIGSILDISPSYLNNHAYRLELPVPRNPLQRTIKEKKLLKKRGKDRSWYREQWLALVENSPGTTRQQLRSRAKGILSWLFYNDCEWLRTNSTAREKSLRRQTSLKPLSNQRRMSEDRDALLAEAVRKAAHHKFYLRQEYPKKMSKRRICREILELRWIPTAQDAPLTAQALKEVTETAEKFALRRIDWALHQYMEEKVSPSRNAIIEKLNLRKIIHHQSVQKALDNAMITLSQLT